MRCKNKNENRLAILAAVGIAAFALWWILLRLIHLVSVQEISSLAFSPDGKSLAAGGGWSAPHGEAQLGGTIWVWDIGTGKLRHHFTSLSQHAMWVAYSPDGRSLASWQLDGTYTLWDAVTGKLLRQSIVPKPKIVPVSVAKQWLTDQEMANWDRRTGPLQDIMNAHLTQGLTPLSISFNHQVAAFLNGKADIELWNLETKQRQSQITHQGTSPQASALSPDGHILAVKSSIRNAGYDLRDTRTGKLLRVLKSQGGNMHLIVFSPDGKLLATENYNGSMEIWDAQTGQLLRAIQAFRN